MKRRIIDRLSSTALAAAQPVYAAIQQDLVEGLGDLEVIIVGMFRDLAQAADEQARIVAQNANIDVGAADKNPALLELAGWVPKWES